MRKVCLAKGNLNESSIKTNFPTMQAWSKKKKKKDNLCVPTAFMFIDTVYPSKPSL